MLTATERSEIYQLVLKTSERRAADMLGVSHMVLQRAVGPLSVSEESEAALRASLSKIDWDTVSEPKAPNRPSAIETLRERERIAIAREERRAARQAEVKAEKERAAADRERRRLDKKGLL